MASAVEITQAVGPTVVALGALWFAAAQQKRNFAHERDLSDRAELRKLLDQAAQTLTRAGGIGSALDSLLLTHGRNLEANAGTVVEKFNEAGRSLELNHERLNIRLGPDAALVKAHDKARTAAHQISHAVSMLTGLGAGDLRESSEALSKANGDMKAARTAFVAEAVKRIGVV